MKGLVVTSTTSGGLVLLNSHDLPLGTHVDDLGGFDPDGTGEVLQHGVEEGLGPLALESRP